MKKFTNLRLWLIAAMFSIASSASAAYIEVDGMYFETNIDAGTAEIKRDDGRYNCYSGDVVIPETVTYNDKTYTVVGIQNGTFYDCSNLTSVQIPETITRIGESAFGKCSSLTSITIPRSHLSVFGHSYNAQD